MPVALDLVGQKFGRLTVIKFDEKKTKEKGYRFWECKCKCGNTASVRGAYLRNNHTRSCSCLIARQRRDAYQADEDYRDPDNSRVYYSARKAARYLTPSVTTNTLRRWANLNKKKRAKTRCPWLDGGTIGTTPVVRGGRPGRVFTYFLKEDLDRVNDARKAPPIPSYPGLVHVSQARRELGVSWQRFWRLVRGRAVVVTKKLGRRVTDSSIRAIARAYVPIQFVQDMKAERSAPGADRMSVKGAATRLGVTAAYVRHIGRQLDVQPGYVPVVPKAGLPFIRAGNTVSRKLVERRKCESFDGVYSMEGGARGFNLDRAAKESGLSRSYLWKQLKRCPCLPEGKLPSVKIARPAGRGRAIRERVVLESDLSRLTDALAAAEKPARQARQVGPLKASEIADRLQFSVSQAIALGVVLPHWRETKQLPAERACVLTAGRRRWIWLYDLDRVKQLVAGRDVGRLAEELKAYGAIAPLAEAALSTASPQPEPAAAMPAAAAATTGEDDGFITSMAACALTALHPSALSRLCRRGKIRFRKPSPRRLMVHPGDLTRYMSEKR